MGNAESVLEIPLEISDVSGQKVFSVSNAPTNNTVGELVHEMLGKMNLPRNDSSGAHRRCARTRRQVDAPAQHRCGSKFLTARNEEIV